MSNFENDKLANPNRQKHYTKKKSRIERIYHRQWLKKKIDKFKLKHGCKHCGSKKYAQQLTFHHRIPEKKSYSIGTMIFRGFSYEAIIKEAKKCDILCLNCHVEAHVEGDLN